MTVPIGCDEIRGSAKSDPCPDCCNHCHGVNRLSKVMWKGQPRMVCCSVVVFAMKHGAEVDNGDLPGPASRTRPSQTGS